MRLKWLCYGALLRRCAVCTVATAAPPVPNVASARDDVSDHRHTRSAEPGPSSRKLKSDDASCLYVYLQDSSGDGWIHARLALVEYAPIDGGGCSAETIYESPNWYGLVHEAQACVAETPTCIAANLTLNGEGAPWEISWTLGSPSLGKITGDANRTYAEVNVTAPVGQLVLAPCVTGLCATAPPTTPPSIEPTRGPTTTPPPSIKRTLGPTTTSPSDQPTPGRTTPLPTPRRMLGPTTPQASGAPTPRPTPEPKKKVTEKAGEESTGLITGPTLLVGFGALITVLLVYVLGNKDASVQVRCERVVCCNFYCTRDAASAPDAQRARPPQEANESGEREGLRHQSD